MSAQIAFFSFCGLRKLSTFQGEFLQWMQAKEYYRAEQINVFIGENGAGKSTILELIDAVRNPNRLATLPRENKKNNVLSAFDLRFTNQRSLIGQSISNGLDEYPSAPELGSSFEQQCLNLALFDPVASKQSIASFTKNVSKSNLDSTSIAELAAITSQIGCSITMWNESESVSASISVEILNDAWQILTGILSPHAPPPWHESDAPIQQTYRKNPFHVIDEAAMRIGVYLSDDSGQTNSVEWEALPSGWRRLVSILGWLRNAPENAICLIEEPETHMHPRLQRYLIREIRQIVEHRTLQLFLTTHSMTFQHPRAWGERFAIFEAAGDYIAPLTDIRRLMDGLGINGSDMSQANGQIWVEGYSDRIYLRHWLRLWCEHHDCEPPVQDIDYVFVAYGGAVLKHLGINNPAVALDLSKISRNFVVIMDRDFDFVGREEDGTLEAIRETSKSRLCFESRAISGTNNFTWITHGYCIETYTPRSFLSRYFDTPAGRLASKSLSKIDIATLYTEQYSRWEQCSDVLEDLGAYIKRLYHAIMAWQG